MDQIAIDARIGELDGDIHFLGFMSFLNFFLIIGCLIAWFCAK